LPKRKCFATSQIRRDLGLYLELVGKEHLEMITHWNHKKNCNTGVYWNVLFWKP